MLLTYFTNMEEPSFGTILTTPTSGSKDLFIIGKGRILIFVPNRYNKNYKKSFIVLNICKENNTFNEAHLLHESNEYYGSMVIIINKKNEFFNLKVVEGNTKLLKLPKGNLS